MSDIATALTASIAKDGQTTPTANLPMGTYRHTGVGDASARTDYASAKQVQDGTLVYLTSVSGTNTITATGAVSMAAYATGHYVAFIPAATNTGAVTLNVNSIGAKNVYAFGAALVGGELVSGVPAMAVYDGTQYQLVSRVNTPRIGTYTATTSGTSVTFGSIPAYVTRIDIGLVGVSLSGGTDHLMIELGDSGGLETTGYLGSVVNPAGTSTATFSTAFDLNPGAASAANAWHGIVSLRLMDRSSNTWSMSSQIATSNTGGVHHGSGSKALSGTLTQFALKVSGTPTDAFDSGAVGYQAS